MKKLLVALLITASATAGFLVEPYVGYQIGSGDKRTTDYTFNSTVLGARVGYQSLGFMGGLDYSMGAKSNLSTETIAKVKDKEKHSQNNLGVFVGYELPILLRAWATYYLSSTLEDQDGTNKGNEYKGDGLGVGVGFTMLPFLSVNVEYRMLSYDELKTSTATTTQNPALDINYVVIGVSLPLDL